MPCHFQHIRTVKGYRQFDFGAEILFGWHGIKQLNVTSINRQRILTAALGGARNPHVRCGSGALGSLRFLAARYVFRGDPKPVT
jgi:hypothetical protein